MGHIEESIFAMQIGEIARETGLTVDTIRFYEKERLLKAAARSEGGFRLFSAEHVGRLRFIQSAQQLGFSLGEIRELLILRTDNAHACSHVRELLQHKLESVRTKVEQLQRLETDLKAALRKCNRVLQNRRSAQEDDCCPVLEQIAHANGPERKK